MMKSVGGHMGFLILLVEGKDSAVDESPRSHCMAGIVGRAFTSTTRRSSLRNKENWDPYNKAVKTTFANTLANLSRRTLTYVHWEEQEQGSVRRTAYRRYSHTFFMKKSWLEDNLNKTKKKPQKIRYTADGSGDGLPRRNIETPFKCKW